MSEFINNNEMKLNLLKDKIRQIGSEEDSQLVSEELKSLLNEVSYEDVIKVEQELFEEGINRDKMLELCDLHTAALKGLINPEAKTQDTPGHPVHTFKKENQAIRREIEILQSHFNKVNEMSPDKNADEIFLIIRSSFNNLMDIEKHYLRKENLLFPFLEKYGITGPSTVMWGKHDQTREMLKNCISVMNALENPTIEDLNSIIELVMKPTVKSIDEMIYKEEKILFPMSLDTLKEEDWLQIYNQGDEIGYCLYSPVHKWHPENVNVSATSEIIDNAKIKLPTGIFNLDELTALFNAMPVDLTFVDKDDNVKFFSHGEDRIFQRNKAILGRKVQYCHPPGSVHIVEKILNDFKNGVQDKASFWINFKERFIYIRYYAVRDDSKNYLGTLEVTQDVTELRKLEGERRILEY
ncbi:MAG: DUF438 domain-containing protein [Ignavibacteriales bacterium]|nr:MAG: DUF438 domain-containing protein [Ignavibacteriales bacterium]